MLVRAQRCSVVLCWVVALLRTVSEVAAGWVGLCPGAAPQDVAGE